MKRENGQGIGLWVALAWLFCSGVIHAQSAAPVTPEEEYKKNIRVSEDIQPLGENPFGEGISLYSGGLSFEQTDVSAVGVGPTLSLSRHYELPTQAEHINLLDNAFGSWDLDLPRITTITANQKNVTGWMVGSGSKAICSSFSAPPTVNPTDPARGPWAPSQWWHGYQLVTPGLGSQDLLARGSANTLAPSMSGMSFPIVTKQHWQISCLAQAENDSTTEAFLAVAPDGTKYWFNHLAYRYLSSVTRGLWSNAVPQSVSLGGGLQPMASATDFVDRREASMFVTRIEDRFGNYLTYSYDSSNRLTSIAASDGRALSVQYADNTPLIHSVTLQPSNSAPRTWTYTYSQGVWGASSKELTAVTLPDGSSWQFALSTLTGNAYPDTTDATSICNAPAEPLNLGTSYSGSITHPSGLVGTFTVKSLKRGRSYVPRQCWQGDPSGQGLPTSAGTFALIPNAWYAMAVTQRQYSGAGMPMRTWTYAYSPSNESWTADSCASAGTCATTVWTDETDPSGNDTRHIFSNRYDASESSLLRTDYYSGAMGGTLVRSEVSGYADPTGGPWPTSLGDNLQSYINKAQTTELSPLNQRIITQDGDTYTWAAEAFNAYAQVTQTKRSNSIAGQNALEESTTYLNDTDLWVLGLPATVTNVATGEVESANTYASNDTLATRARFGQTLMSYAFDSAGNLASFTDGNNHTTTLGSYKRGISQAIGYPDGTSESLAVDDFGQIASITDQAGNTTSYAYDPVGRLTQISYPGGDEQSWYPQTFTYDFVASAERGLAANHWRRTSSQGNARQVTYFDSELRPILSDTYDSSNSSSHTSARTDYDWKGQTTFVSYPASGSPDLSGLTAGTTSAYDALGRLTQSQQTSELGTLTTTTAYLSGAWRQVTDPKGNVTTTGYQVFDEPVYDTVIQVQAPAGITQTITRDVYGNPTAIHQYGSNDGLSGDVTKTLLYDSYHRPCRTTEPESGSTVTAYDGANNVAWTAEGLSLTGTDCGQDQVADAAKTVRTYDAMNRVLTLTPPSGTQGTTYGYDALGNVQSAVSGISTWSATRNKRGQLTGETLQLIGQPAWTAGYAHDAYGNLQQLTYPDGEAVNYAPDALGRATQAGGYASGITYFPNGELASYSYGSGATYVAEQNDRQLLSNFSHGQGGTLAVSEDRTYDADGNLTTITDLVDGTRSKSFGYDALNRLANATANQLWGTESYAYDPLNNLRTRVSGGSTFTYNYDANNRLAAIVADSASSPFGYDSRGNVISKNGVALSFDAKNQLLGVAGAASYAYDAAGRRVSKTPNGGVPTYYFYNQAGQLLYQLNTGTTQTTAFVYLGHKLIAWDENYHTQITGHIDGVSIDGSNNATVTGWACSTGIAQSIDVDLYVGGPYGTGTMIGRYAANQSSEPTVASACGVSSGSYLFAIPLSLATRNQYAGQGIYIHGISPAGQANLVLPNSGTYAVPMPLSAPANLGFDANPNNGSYTVSWAATSGASSYTLQEQADGGSWNTAYTGGATSQAFSGKEGGSYAYQVQACNGSICSGWTSSATLGVTPALPTVTVPTGTINGTYTVSWSAPASTTGYDVQESLNGGAWTTIASATTATSISRPGTTSGSYTYQVSASNAYGTRGWAASGAVTVDTTYGVVPAAPASLSVPAASNDGSATLSWSAANLAARYVVEQSTDGGTRWSNVYDSSGTSTALSGLTDGSYVFQVQACNTYGCSGWTPGNATLVVTHPPSTAPGLTVPGSSANGSYTVSWTGVGGATSYTLQEQVNGGGWTTVQADGATSWGTSGRGNGSYGYQVQACNAGGCGPWSAVASTTVLYPPAAPASLSVPATSTGSIAVSWAASDTATSYTLQQNANGAGWGTVYSGGATGTTVGVGSTGSYSYQVQACNSSGCSGWTGSGAVAVTIPPSSAPSLSVPGSSGTGSYTVSWTGVDGASSYTLQEQVNGGGWTTVQANASTSWGASGKGDGTYGYQVQACNAGGCSGWSTPSNVSVSLVPGVDSAPSVTGSSGRVGNVSASWAVVANATSYQVEVTMPDGVIPIITQSGTTYTGLVHYTGSVKIRVNACNSSGCGGWSGYGTTYITVTAS